MNLFSEFEAIEDLAVFVGVFPLKVIQEGAPFGDEFEEPAAGVVVPDVVLEMVPEGIDALRQKGDLHLAGAGVVLFERVLFDDMGFRLFGQRHDGRYYINSKGVL